MAFCFALRLVGKDEHARGPVFAVRDVLLLASVAQLAEQLICNQQVAGSIPIASFLLEDSVVS